MSHICLWVKGCWLKCNVNMHKDCKSVIWLSANPRSALSSSPKHMLNKNSFEHNDNPNNLNPNCTQHLNIKIFLLTHFQRNYFAGELTHHTLQPICMAQPNLCLYSPNHRVPLRLPWPASSRRPSSRAARQRAALWSRASTGSGWRKAPRPARLSSRTAWFAGDAAASASLPRCAPVGAQTDLKGKGPIVLSASGHLYVTKTDFHSCFSSQDNVFRVKERRRPKYPVKFYDFYFKQKCLNLVINK